MFEAIIENEIFLIIVRVISIITTVTFGIQYFASRNKDPDYSSAADLMKYCEEYWKKPVPFNKQIKSIKYQRYERALLELKSFGNEASSWAVDNLSHHYFMARDACARLVGDYFQKNHYEYKEDKVVRELLKICSREIGEDPENIHDIYAAVDALGKCDCDLAKLELTEIITSDDDKFDNYIKILAADALGHNIPELEELIMKVWEETEDEEEIIERTIEWLDKNTKY